MGILRMHERCVARMSYVRTGRKGYKNIVTHKYIYIPNFDIIHKYTTVLSYHFLKFLKYFSCGKFQVCKETGKHLVVQFKILTYLYILVVNEVNVVVSFVKNFEL